jgi:hypothetical protein
VLWPIRRLHVSETATATGNHDAVEHYCQIAGVSHASLARLALGWRETGTIPEPAAARAQLTAELLPSTTRSSNFSGATSAPPRR